MRRYKLAGRTIAGMLLLCATVIAAGKGTKVNLLDASGVTVGSVSAKNSNLGNFVTNTSLQKGEPDTQYYVFVLDLATASTPYYAGTFFTNARGKGGVLYVTDAPELSQVQVVVSDEDPLFNPTPRVVFHTDTMIVP